MPLKQIKDDNNEVISSVFIYQYGKARKLVANTTSSNSTTFSSDTKMITVVVDAPVFFEQNIGSVPVANNTSHYLVANETHQIGLREYASTSNSFVAFLGVNISANVYISPRS